jgi:uridine kinase
MRHLRIDTRDVSLLRLLLRNLYYHNIPAATSIEQWHSLYNNEKWRIFPLLEKSDIVFNSSLVYELGVLRVKAVPVLETVSPDHPSSPEARRLLQVLSYFSPIQPHNVPSHSVLREFIGDSRFDAVFHPGDLSEV